MYYYSAKENSFYPNELMARYQLAKTWPADAVAVTNNEWQVYGQGEPPEGMKRGSDENGRPVWVPIPPPGPEPVPQQVTRAQGKAVLIQAGLWQAVLDYVDSITDPTEKALAEVALNDTTHWRRDSPFLNAAAQALGLTSEQLDDLLIQAAGTEL